MNPYDVDIRKDLESAAKKAGVRLVPGWFPARIPLPASVYYLLAATPSDYFANQPTTVKFSYYFEVRALDEESREQTAKALCKALSQIYFARRTQYDDSFDQNFFIKRIVFLFTVKLGV